MPVQLQGAGLGLRRAFLGALQDGAPPPLDFIEAAPENWAGMGGRHARQFRAWTERYPLVCHGLSLSLGGPHPLDYELLRDVRTFIDAHGAILYSEHLSYTAADGHLYDLLPIPFTEEAVRYVGDRIRQTQDFLERRIALENVSYYAAPGRTMEETDFVTAVLEEADCDLLLDVNNVYVNSVNHGYDPQAFIAALPRKRIAYLHVAGHFLEAPDLLVDTHGADVVDPVWDLLRYTYAQFGPLPTLLERDFHIPPLDALLTEVTHVRRLQAGAQHG